MGFFPFFTHQRCQTSKREQGWLILAFIAFHQATAHEARIDRPQRPGPSSPQLARLKSDGPSEWRIPPSTKPQRTWPGRRSTRVKRLGRWSQLWLDLQRLSPSACERFLSRFTCIFFSCTMRLEHFFLRSRI